MSLEVNQIEVGFTNVIAHGGGSGYFISALITKIMLEEIIFKNYSTDGDTLPDSDFVFKKTDSNEYYHDGFSPLCSNYHHDSGNSHFYGLGIKNEDEIVELLKPYINFFIICDDSKTFDFCRIMHIAKHEWGNCNGNLDNFKSKISSSENIRLIKDAKFVFYNGTKSNPDEFGFFNPTKQLANKLQDISKDNNIVIDYKDLFFDRNIDLIKKICGMIKCESRYPLMNEKIEEYTNKNIELYNTVLEIIGEQ